MVSDRKSCPEKNVEWFKKEGADMAKNDTSFRRAVKHAPNPFHLANCKNRATMTRDRTKYTRKVKHKGRDLDG